MATHSSLLAWRILMDRGAWQATVQRVAKSLTQWSNEAHADVAELGRDTRLRVIKSLHNKHKILKFLQMPDARLLEKQAQNAKRGCLFASKWLCPKVEQNHGGFISVWSILTHRNQDSRKGQQHGWQWTDSSWMFPCCTNMLSDLCPGLTFTQDAIQICISKKRPINITESREGPKKVTLAKAVSVNSPGLMDWISGSLKNMIGCHLCSLVFLHWI